MRFNNLFPKHRKNNALSYLLVTALVFAILLGLALVPSTSVKAEESESAKDIVNVGVTYTLNTMNPFLYDATLVNHAAISLQFLPLVELNSDMSFEYLIASDVKTEDNKTFEITIDEEANWSNGDPITSDDVLFTIMKITSQGVGNLNIYNYSAMEGFDEGGQLPDDAKLEDVPSLEKIDDKKFTMTTMSEISLSAFMSSYLRYIYTVPQAVFAEMSGEELRTTTWFNEPEIVSGPYRLVDLNLDHYASYEAVEDYWRGTPKISNLNIRVVEGSGILAGLQSGELDVVPATMAAIPMEDQAVIAELPGFVAEYDKPLTNNYFFINNDSVPQKEVRQAMAYGINRELILEGFLNNNGEITEGFLNSYSPFKNTEMEVRAFDPEKAQSLVEESDWDKDKELLFLTNSGDPTFQNAANVVAQQLEAIGIKVKVQAMDLGSLLAEVNNGRYDVMCVQYTMVPIAPLDDISWLAQSGEEIVNWSHYASEEMNEAIDNAYAAKEDDEEGIIEAYSAIDELIKEDTPLINLYVESPLGIMNEKLENARVGSFGAFNNVQEWIFAE